MYNNLKQLVESDWFILVVGGILLFLIVLFYTPTTRAQSVILRGDTFICKDSVKAKPHPTMTKYLYQAPNGTKYPIYMSASGKCFIIKTSPKTGKQYKQYLPEVTKKLYNGR